MAHNDAPRTDDHRPAEPIGPQEPTQQYPGWGAPQQGQPGQGWGAPPEQLYAQPGPGWGAAPGKGPHPAAARWRGLTSTQKGVAAAAAAVVIAGGAGAAVWAANSSSSSADGSAANGFGGAAAGQGGFGPQGGTGAQGGQNAQGFQNGTRGFGGAGGMGIGTLGQMLHGEFVVVQDNANVTMVEQTGTVTAVSGQSVTVKSSDGFQQTYALSSSTQIAARGMRGRGTSGSGTSTTESLAEGESVNVMALKDGLAAQTVMILGTGTGTGTSSGSTSN
ncbi:hypothetical protein J2W21_000201 [Sinomonas atrocyanea]|uniref:hypothetical protein n=1 Tax=Sinomonas atrocyanea TaxID=37927 RepID=UPI002787EF9B|nr:hypothetical protein [Sinomonas atrocyanea]MDP9882722.1 hypothetical protein [Sinomonas atrocyanea]